MKSLSTEERAQIVNLSNLTFFLLQIAKMVKVSKTAVHNAIMKYQNEGAFIDKKRSGRPRVNTSREDRLESKAVTHFPMSTSKKIQAKFMEPGTAIRSSEQKYFDAGCLWNLASNHASQPENYA